ncbi:DNA-directed DNA polymerase, family B, conserved site [Trema orientale]|uniref:DNA-directed DNA polymerase, family B, conserved site n=1 Tax=Trema orientale TaxID=63057 RepID=A0A2P5FHZ1_TREOI|nr:DNA-directed DNA polymerase, family B, conserved site [Trema orientale]
MNGGLSKLGTALIAVFAVCLVVLVADLVYVIWRRRRFQRRATSATGESVLAGDTDSIYVLSSKELLYLFCWQNRSRVEPNGTNGGTNQLPDPDNDPNHAEADDRLKLQGLYGQSRLLFTITEEDGDDEAERTAEGLEKEADGSDDRDRVCTGSTLTDDVAVSVDVEVVVVDDDATPFSTPCASPPYYTPPPSPSREELNEQYLYSNESVSNIGVLFGDQLGGREGVPPFVSLEIISV